MLLRELKLRNRMSDRPGHWLATLLPLQGGKSLYIEKYIAEEVPEPWHMGLNLRPLNSSDSYELCNGEHERVWHGGMTEFEAQAVLDHYLQTIGPSHHDNN